MSRDEREAELQAVVIGSLEFLDSAVTLREYDSRWPRWFGRQTERIGAALGERVLRLEHVGSTAVAGLVAKPRIDVLLVVAEPADEVAYARCRTTPTQTARLSRRSSGAVPRASGRPERLR